MGLFAVEIILEINSAVTYQFTSGIGDALRTGVTFPLSKRKDRIIAQDFHLIRHSHAIT
jgi:hypothetical protein